MGTGAIILFFGTFILCILNFICFTILQKEIKGIKEFRNSQEEFNQVVTNKLTKKECKYNINEFVKLISDGSLSEETGYGYFVFEDKSYEDINWNFINVLCHSTAKKYDQECLCDISKNHFNSACRDVEEGIGCWKNSSDSTISSIKWYWENV